MDKKLWVIGDSFTGIGYRGVKSWTEIVSENFNGKKFYISSKGSRDFQTILDIFLRNLKNISPNDFVILVIPTLIRTRVPLKIPNIDIELSNESRVDLKDCKDYFVGTSSYSKNSPNSILEPPLNYSEEKDMEKGSELWSIVNSSNASKQNYLKIIESLKSYLPFEIFIWSWTDEFESDLIFNKSKIKKELGIWHTLHNLYNETNGKEGYEGDAHFSKQMNEKFAEYIIKQFSQHFK